MIVTLLAVASALSALAAGVLFAAAATRTERRYVAYMPIPCFVAADLQLGYALYSSGAIA